MAEAMSAVVAAEDTVVVASVVEVLLPSVYAADNATARFGPLSRRQADHTVVAVVEEGSENVVRIAPEAVQVLPGRTLPPAKPKAHAPGAGAVGITFAFDTDSD